MKENSLKKSEMISKMQKPGVFSRPKLYTHALSALQLQAKQCLGMSTRLQHGFWDWKNTSDIFTQQTLENENQESYSARTNVTVGPSIFLKPKFAELLLLQSWAILAHNRTDFTWYSSTWSIFFLSFSSLGISVMITKVQKDS